MMNSILQYLLYIIILVLCAYPLGGYIYRVMKGDKTLLSPILFPCERLILKILHIHPDDQMNWKMYTLSVFSFSIISFMILFFLLMMQGSLPGNPLNLPSLKWDLAFNTAVSFMTNTNWQAYNGESTLSFLAQALGLTVQNFVSAAVGIAVLFVLIRGFIKTKSQELGNFWVDLTRITLHLLLPLNVILSLLLAGGGVIQNLKGIETVDLLEPLAVDVNGVLLEDAEVDLMTHTVTIDGQVIEDAEIITKQFVPMGLAASQIAIKQSGTNGGGYLGTNSAHPFENPNSFTNLIQLISILLIPVALCFTFGKAVKNKKQGNALFISMLICLCLAMVAMAYSEQFAPTQLSDNQHIDLSMNQQAGGNMEGKETRFGIASSVTWSAFTTSASNGSVNSMLDSYTPIGGMTAMILIQLGEVIFGGAGSGLYGLLAFVILTVFIAGLMVGRTPEFLGKKIEPYEMKYAVLICLATPIAILVGSGIAAAYPATIHSLGNSSAHGFSELLYAFTSAGGNNGSAFAGFQANTLFFNMSLACVMLFARFLPIWGTLAIAGSLAAKKKMASSAGTLSTTNTMFIFLLILVVVLIGALNFFPALALGPIAEYLQSLV